jgi:hypothetical protein
MSRSSPEPLARRDADRLLVDVQDIGLGIGDEASELRGVSIPMAVHVPSPRHLEFDAIERPIAAGIAATLGAGPGRRNDESELEVEGS